MRRSFLFLLPALLLGGVFAPPASAAGEAVVAVVDIIELIEKHPETIALTKAYEERLEAADRTLQEANKRLQEIVRQLKESSEGPDRDRLEEQFERTKAQNEIGYKLQRMRANRQWLKELVSIYKSIQRTIADYAMRKNIDLVVHRNSDDIVPTDKNDFVLKVLVRGALYHSQRLDITDAILAILKQ